MLQELEAGQEATARNTGMLFNIALNYGGRAEIVDAARRAIEAGVRAEISTSGSSPSSSTPPDSPIPIC